MTANAFGQSKVELGECVDLVSWTLQLDPDVAQDLGTPFLTCENFDRVLEYNCLATPYCTSLFLNLVGSGGITVQNACCEYGGGFEYGVSVLMDKFSPITCRPSIEDDLYMGLRGLNGVICFCSDVDDRYNVEIDFCVNGCEPGHEWIVLSSPNGVG